MVNELAQDRYANWLEVGARISLAVMVLGFALYMGGVLEPYVPLERLPSLWKVSAHEYVTATSVPLGWSWLLHLHQADMLAVVGVALLALCSVPGVLSLVPLYRLSGDRIYVILCLAQVAVLLLSASGVVAAH